MTKKEADRKTEAQKWAVNRLRESLPVGAKIYTLRVHASRTGYSKSFQVLVSTNHFKEKWGWLEESGILEISSLTAKATQFKFDQIHGGVKTTDNGAHIVAELSNKLFGRWDALRHCGL